MSILNGGKKGIRTLGSAFANLRFSKPPQSTTLPSFLILSLLLERRCHFENQHVHLVLEFSRKDLQE